MESRSGDSVAGLTARWADMVLEDEEVGLECDEAAQVATEAVVVSWSLVGRFLTNHLVKVEYKRQMDMQRVLEDGPWSFENSTLVCKQVGEGEFPGGVVLDSVDLWAHVYDLLVCYTTDVILEQVGNFIGSFVRCDDRQLGGAWKTFYRIRVSILVAKPLKRQMKLIRRDKSWGWVNFKYEQLHTFCFLCGLFGHSDKFCLKGS
ncbi:PREDICTED: uncharacterized protein LOC109168892 [Ipomoea nil]|uniref:uncharacterized protein LOC109168892 n=1 Tax=Ipomoea nil TaxID=35883 RepID=UPI000900FBB5|nr:PREDICTED: uncharacterized protein LOC109168892 [Ipomoea nil]